MQQAIIDNQNFIYFLFHLTAASLYGLSLATAGQLYFLPYRIAGKRNHTRPGLKTFIANWLLLRSVILLPYMVRHP